MTNDRNLATKLASPWSVRFTRCGLADTPLDSDSRRCVLQENTEKPKCKVDQDCLRIIEKLDPAERPLDILGHGAGSFSSYVPVYHIKYGIDSGADPKCRFFWKMTEKPPYETAFPSLNMPNVVPEALKDIWADTLNKWGTSMKNACAMLFTSKVPPN